MGFVLSLVADRNHNGYDISSRKYDEIKSKAQKKTRGRPAVRSAFTQARKKLHWSAFRFLLERLNEQTRKLAERLKWKGHHVYAIDGTTINFPHQREIIKKFPFKRGAVYSGHFPKGKLVLATNINTGIPKTACLAEECYQERTALEEIISEFEKDSILLLDRGYEGFRVMQSILRSKLNFVVRIRTEFKSQKLEIKKFLASGKKDGVVTLIKGEEELTVRLIYLGKDRNNRPIVIATSLLNKKSYSRKSVIQLYLSRWKIETFYYQMKDLLSLEKFHAKSLNGVFQELWANLLYMGLTSAHLVQCQMKIKKNSLKKLSFKSAVEWTKENLHYLIYRVPNLRSEDLVDLLITEFLRVYHFFQPGRKNPRVSKQTYNRWCGGMKNKAIDRYRAKSMSKKNKRLTP